MDCSDLKHAEHVDQMMAFEGRLCFYLCLVRVFNLADTYTERYLNLYLYLQIASLKRFQ